MGKSFADVSIRPLPGGPPGGISVKGKREGEFFKTDALVLN